MKSSLLSLVTLVLVLFCEGQTIASILVNPSAETGDVSGWTPANSGGLSPFADSGGFNPGINPYSGNFAFVGGNGPLNTLTQNVSLPSNGIGSASIDTGLLIAQVEFFAQGLNQGATSDSPFISLTFRDGSNASLGTVMTPEVDSHNLAWTRYDQAFAIPVGTRSIDYTMNFVRHVGTDNDAYVDDNSLTIADTIAAVPEPASLTIFSAAMAFLVGGRWIGRKRRQIARK